MIYVDHKVPQVCKVFSIPVLLSQVGMVFFLVIWGNTTSKGIINIACKCQIRVKLHLFTHRFQGESTYKLLQLKVRKPCVYLHCFHWPCAIFRYRFDARQVALYSLKWKMEVLRFDSLNFILWKPLTVAIVQKEHLGYTVQKNEMSRLNIRRGRKSGLSKKKEHTLWCGGCKECTIDII